MGAKCWLAVCVIIASAHGADADKAKLVGSYHPNKLESRFAYREGLRFIDDDRYAVVTECTKGAARLLVGRVSKPAAPKAVATLASCLTFVGDGVVVAAPETGTGKLRRYRLADGKELPAIAVPDGLQLHEILAADLTTVVANTRESHILVAFEDTRAPLKIDVPESNDWTPVSARLEPGGKLWFALPSGPHPEWPHGIDNTRIYTWDLATNRSAQRLVDGDCTRPWPLAASEVACVIQDEGVPSALRRLDAKGHEKWSVDVKDSVADPIAPTAKRDRFIAARAGFAAIDDAGAVRYVDAPAKAAPTAIAVSPSGDHVLAGYSDGGVSVWDLR